MLKHALSLAAFAIMSATPAMAELPAGKGAWTASDDTLRIEAAGIALPQTIAGLSLSKSGEVTQGGKGIDNYAQYLSSDGVVQATLYVYMPSHADASLAAYMTDRAIMERFGSRTRRTAYEAVPVSREQRGAIRAVYDDAAEGTLTTAASFIHAGNWIVKLRITGPTERRAEILSGMDGMLKALQFDQPSQVHATNPARFVACPGHDGMDARMTHARVPTQAAINLPSEGSVPFCIRGEVQAADGKFDMLQQAGTENGLVMVLVDDSGTLLAFKPSSDEGFRMTMHSLGRTEIYGVYDRIPSPRQIAAILEDQDQQTAKAHRVVEYTANGRATSRAADVER